ncbi:MAG: precorrin-6y C5,15-methyltransferase (decarboxylating) subunit CbiE [Oscillatoriales cyanobacterium C42_A2020_001]|nr:precorrin-6y C5,15-methyltransferase (decarboxylating) subunit CbiE [Leptolyngbyaceae cyanobacterium C42_A2020_001]
MIHVVGIGLEGTTGLTEPIQVLIEQATLLVGSARHLNYVSNHSCPRVVLGDLGAAIEQIRQHLSLDQASLPSAAQPLVIVLTSGDPLFFGLGRLLLAEFPADQLTFHPHLSSIQLAFSRVKLPWQDARVVSAHGRSPENLIHALQQGAETMAVLTDGTSTPAAIAQLLQALDLPTRYRIWVCENLGGSDERVTETTDWATLADQSFAPLNVVILKRLDDSPALRLDTLPLMGIPDQAFLSFRDRPGLMTKREVRTLALGELALQPDQIVWDIGAGTGSVSIEIARLCPGSTIYAIEKTAAGVALIQQNCQRFQVENVQLIHGAAPAALTSLPAPDRVFIGGSGGNLNPILNACAERLVRNGRIVIAIATIEHLTTVFNWLTTHTTSGDRWSHHLLQVNLSRAVPVSLLTRLSPLNPVTIITLERGLPSSI